MTPKNNKNKSKSKTSASSSMDSNPAAKKSGARTVGQILKKARLEKGFRLTQIVQQLNISQSYIQAIENGKINELPKEQTYTIGFVKSYAQAVDLDVQEIVDQFKQEFYEKSDQYELVENEIEAEDAVADENNDAPNSKVLWGSFGVAVLAIIIGYAVSKSSLFSGDTEVQDSSVTIQDGSVMTQESTENSMVKKKAVPTSLDAPLAAQQPLPQTKTAPDQGEVLKQDPGVEKKGVTFVYKNKENDKVVATTDPSDSVLTMVDDKSSAENTEKSVPIKEDKGFVSDPNKLPILITVSEDTWIEIKDPVNEDLYLSKVISPGYIYQVPKKGLVLSTGNAGATIITVGSNSLPSIGKEGKVMHDIYLGAVELKDKYIK
tara:strand:- start:572 stop:1699 length:1128 start_codon:yes stop_codon:yes gene_type:complete